MNRVLAVALNTFREAVRDRVLYVVLALASAVLVFTLALAELSLDQQRRVVRDVGLASISLFSVLVAIFLGSSLLYKEIERKTLYVILPKPIHRWEFLVGKFFGIGLTGAIFVLLMGSIQLLVMILQTQRSLMALLGAVMAVALVGGIMVWRARDRTFVWVPMAVLAFGGTAFVGSLAGLEVESVAAGLVLYIAELTLLTAIALFFSSFSTPFTTGALTFGVWLLGRSADTMETIRSRLLSDELIAFLRATAKVVPNLNLFVPGPQTADEPWGYVAQAMTYSAVYTAILLILAASIFRRRDFV